jgi:hypothetical protein
LSSRSGVDVGHQVTAAAVGRDQLMTRAFLSTIESGLSVRQRTGCTMPSLRKISSKKSSLSSSWWMVRRKSPDSAP